MNNQNNQNTYGDDVITIEDNDNWNNTPLGIKELALRQFHECQKAGSKELNPGGVRRIMIDGRVEEIVEPDTGQIFCNTVKMLEITLKSQIRSKEKEMKQEKEYDDAKKELRQIRKDYNDELSRLKSLPAYQRSKININELAVKYDRIIYQKKIELHILLLEKLSILMSLHNYFNEEAW